MYRLAKLIYANRFIKDAIQKYGEALQAFPYNGFLENIRKKVLLELEINVEIEGKKKLFAHLSCPNAEFSFKVSRKIFLKKNPYFLL